VVFLEQDPERAAFVKNLQFNVICLDETNLDEKIRENAPDGFDLIYDTAGHAGTTDKMVQHMKQQGTMLMQSQYFDRERCAVDLNQIKIRELMIKTTCGIDDQDWLATSNYIGSRHLQIAPLITHRFKSTDALKGYELLNTGKPFNLGIVFHWDED